MNGKVTHNGIELLLAMSAVVTNRHDLLKLTYHKKYRIAKKNVNRLLIMGLDVLWGDKEPELGGEANFKKF